jgi:hypothetical protein
MRQYLFASGAVRFYRGGVKVGELPYQSGSYWPSVTNSEACLSQPRLWNEIGDFAAAGYGHSYWGSTAPVDPTRALVIECDVAGTNFPLGLSSQTVLADCDRITFEIDRLEFPSSTWAMAWTGSNTCNAIVPFLAVLSQPATR